MERLKSMKDTLIACVQAQMSNLGSTNAQELGEAVDMIKDLSEAIYYCTVTEAMEEYEEEENPYSHNRYYSPMKSPKYHHPGDVDRMYYDGALMRSFPKYHEDSYPMEIRDHREGKSPITRRNYMESKELHQDKSKQMKELEKYIKELSEDIYEMIEDATPEEKTILSQKLSALASKVM